jgi:hypothetical protein
MVNKKQALAVGASASAIASGVMVATAAPASAWNNVSNPYVESVVCEQYGVRQWGLRITDEWSPQQVILDHNCPISTGREMRTRVKYRTDGGAGPVRFTSGQWADVPTNATGHCCVGPDHPTKFLPARSHIVWVCAGIRETTGAWNIRQAGRNAPHTDAGCNMDFWSNSPDHA